MCCDLLVLKIEFAGWGFGVWQLLLWGFYVGFCFCVVAPVWVYSFIWDSLIVGVVIMVHFCAVGWLFDAEILRIGVCVPYPPSVTVALAH